MGEKGFFAKLFGKSNEDENRNEIQQVNEEVLKPEEEQFTLQNVISFVSELQSYYYNDICKIRTESLTRNDISEDEEEFLKKKLIQESVAMNHIDSILKDIVSCEREYQSIWGKSVYSFYNEIEKEKLKEVQEKVFKVMVKLNQVNVKSELETIILERLEQYRIAWNLLEDIEIPNNTSLVILSRQNGEETYKFGKFKKVILIDESIPKYELSFSQLKSIRDLKVTMNFENPTEELWIRISVVSRLELNFMKRTSIFPINWKETEKTESYVTTFDVVKCIDLQDYLKGMLQLLLTRNTYVILTVINPSDYMQQILKSRVKYKEGKVSIIGLKFILDERSQIYKDNLQVSRIDRRNIPEDVKFLPFTEFKKKYF